MKKQILAAILAFVMLLTLLSGCTSGAEQTSPPDPGASPAAAETHAGGDNVGEQAAQEDIYPVVNVGIVSDPGDFNPFTISTDGKTSALWGIYQPLCREASDGSLIPVLAKDWEWAEDGRSIDFVLYDNIFDTDGNQLKASDIEYCWNTATANGYISGVSFVGSVSAVDEYAVHVEFTQDLEEGNMKKFLELNYVTQAAYEGSGNEMTTAPVGTGPYYLSSYTPAYMMTYERKDAWWQDPALADPCDHANVQTINYYFIAESTQRTIALQNGTIDLCMNVSTEDIPMFENGGQYANDYWVYTIPNAYSTRFFINCNESRPTSDLYLRLAICYCINADVINQSVYSGKGTTQYSMCGPYAVGYQTAWDTDGSCQHYDLEKAKEYLAMSNYNGEKLVIMCGAMQEMTDCCLLIQSFLEQIGINATVWSIEDSLVSTYRNDKTKFDLYFARQGGATTVASGIAGMLDQRRYTDQVEENLIHVLDDELQDIYIRAVSQFATAEDVNALQQRVNDNAYGRGLVTIGTDCVVPSFIETVCLSYKNVVVPGGCTYTTSGG